MILSSTTKITRLALLVFKDREPELYAALEAGRMDIVFQAVTAFVSKEMSDYTGLAIEKIIPHETNYEVVVDVIDGFYAEI